MLRQICALCILTALTACPQGSYDPPDTTGVTETGTSATSEPTPTSGTSSGTSDPTTSASTIDSPQSTGAECKDGTETCQCYGNDTCNDDLKCVEGVCEACPNGTDQCLCYGNDTCNDDLKCVEGVCEECVLGTEECPCHPNQTCNDPSNECIDNKCVSYEPTTG